MFFFASSTFFLVLYLFAFPFYFSLILPCQRCCRLDNEGERVTIGTEVTLGQTEMTSVIWSLNPV